jgi:hypothetical protein
MAALTNDQIMERLRNLNRPAEEQTYFEELRSNIGPSANAALQDFIAVVSDPIGTAKNTYDLGVGLYSLATDGDAPEEEIARALGDYYVDRYGSLEAFQNSAKTDPVGVALDLASVFSGVAGGGRAGITLSQKVSEKAGATKTAEFLSKLEGSKLSDAARSALILSDVGSGAIVGRAAKALPEALGQAAATTAGVISGASADSILRAGEVGRRSMPFGSRAKRFQDTAAGEGNLNVSPEQFASDVDAAGTALRNRIRDQYLQGKSEIDMGGTNVFGQQETRTIVPRLNMAPEVKTTATVPPQVNRPFFSQSFSKLASIKKERDAAKGDFSDAETFDELTTNQAIDRIEAEIIEFSKSPLPDKEAAFRLRAKLDKLDYKPGTPEFAFRNDLRANLSTQLKQDPQYKKIVEDFDQANQLADEIFSELSLGRTKNTSQKLRKLQSVTRNNVNTNFGRRVDLLANLNPDIDYDPIDVASALSLQSTQPMGGSRIGQAGAQTGGILSAGQEGTSIPQMVLSAAAASGVNPRNVGRAAFTAGRIGKAVSPITVPLGGILPQVSNAAFALERADPRVNDTDIEELRRRLEAAGVIR